jgi:hypothetical protein
MARDIFFKEPDQPKHSGEDIHADIDGTIYFRDLLSFLIKTYGH